MNVTGIKAFVRRHIIWIGTAVAAVIVASIAAAVMLSRGEALPAAVTETFAPAATVSAPPSPNPSPSPSPSPSPTLAPEPTPTPPRDPLTGAFTDEASANARPYALSISNLKAALPHSGIGQASIIYETLAEWDITRFVAVFPSGFVAEKIGPIRSARAYFLRYAKDNDAVMVHHGGSSSVVGANGAYEDIKLLGVENIDAMSDAYDTFWRDPVRARQKGMLEHSSYTNAERIKWTAGKKGFVRDRAVPGMFDFYGEFTQPPGGRTAVSLKPMFSDYVKAYFEYDGGVYKRFEFGAPQIDDQTGEQLSVTNILIQFTDVYVLRGDPEGRREVRLTGGGEGYWLSGGYICDIEWHKDDYATPTVWTRDGEPLKLNVGKTWVCVLDSETEIVLNDGGY
ncbi:MAG: DUF3048 domain-containing protein [Clostridiales bacterium]|jgi:hypothetical protein|nr:DUF3048 domain-containing protein [Clostridiales bacterium]